MLCASYTILQNLGNGDFEVAEVVPPWKSEQNFLFPKQISWVLVTEHLQ